MSWILYALALYLAASYGLLVYIVSRLALHRPMPLLVGSTTLNDTRAEAPPAEPRRLAA